MDWLPPVFLGVLFIFALLALVKNARETARYRGWDSWFAKIISRKVLPSDKPGGGAPAFRYEGRIEYRYEVDGSQFTGNRMYPESPISSRESTQAFLDRIPNEIEIKRAVFNGQEESVYLRPGGQWLILLATTIFLGMGLVISLVAAAG